MCLRRSEEGLLPPRVVEIYVHQLVTKTLDPIDRSPDVVGFECDVVKTLTALV